MASLSVEEENYVRMSLLLTGISPRAARTFFDSEFAPACLEATIKTEYNKLLDLKKKHRINQSQWNLLCPRFPDVPDSKTFDVTLMILLLRNLTPITPPLCGFDRLPSAMETTPAADLARIKHYRNHLAHLDGGKLDTGFFNIAWNDITCAVDRLGGQHMMQECDHLKTKPLDQTNQEIMMDIKRSNDEIKGLQKSLKNLKRSHIDMRKSHKILQENHEKVKKSHEMLQEDHAHMTKEMEIMKTSQQDTVPWNIRAKNEQLLKTWKDSDDKMFVNTRAAEHIFKCIKENSCVTITANSGVGKTATLRHVALQMVEEYDVLVVTEPGDILRFYNPNQKTLFVVDDLCGNFSLDQSDIKCWEPILKDIRQNLEKNQTKILAACRLQVYLDEKFDSLSSFKSCVCNMLSKKYCLSKPEKELIAKLYLNAKASEISDFYDIYDCFPLLCKLYHDNPELIITDFFQNPFSIYETEIDKFLKKGHHAKYCALALCVIFNNKLKEKMLTEELNEQTRAIIENTCEACRLDRGTSRLVLQDELDSLTRTFIKKENNVYKILHDKIFDFLAKIYGKNITYCLIRNADSGLIKERFLLETKDNMDPFITIVPAKYHQMYIQRMIDDWSKGKLQDVFSNINMKIPQFRQKLLCYLKTLDISNQTKLANICDEHKYLLKNRDSCYSYIFDEEEEEEEDDEEEEEEEEEEVEVGYTYEYAYKTSLLHCCYLGDMSFVKWLFDRGVDCNTCDKYKESPVITACQHGHTEIVKMLLDRGANYNKYGRYGESPVMRACEYGHIEIVNMLLDRGADYNKCDLMNQTPVMKACENGHIEIVKMLLDREADYNKCAFRGQTPLMKACENGHIEIVKILLDRGADYKKCEWGDSTPVIKACENGHTDIVKMLLDRGADYNECGWRNQTPVMKACEKGHIEILKMLLDRGANYNEYGCYGESSVMRACFHGHTDIVKMLLDIGADYSTCDKDGDSPVMMACQYGHTEILRMLLDRGANYSTCGKDGDSPVMMACQYGHTEILRMLLDRGADYNKGDNDDSSPFIEACEHGHTEIVKMLLDRGVDCNQCDMSGESPVMMAFGYGHTEILRMLLERGADYYKCDEDDSSPLIEACHHGHTEIVKILLDIGADCNQCDRSGQSPVMIACEQGNKEMIKMLLGRGADCNKCDGQGQSALKIAYEIGNKAIIAMIHQHTSQKTVRKFNHFFFKCFKGNNNQNQGVNKDAQNKRTFTSTVINNN